MATYKQIQHFVKEKHDRVIKTCWISHAKEVHGLLTRSASNRKSIEMRVSPCPDKELKWIEEAFLHYKMIK